MWINYKDYGLNSVSKINGVYAIIKIEDDKVMSIGESKNLYQRFATYNKVVKGTNKVKGIKDKEIKEHPELYTIKILEQNINEDELMDRQAHWQRAYHTNYYEGGWDIVGAKWSQHERSQRNYNKDKEIELRRKRFIEHPEKHEAAKQKQREAYQRNKEDYKAKRKMQTIFKDKPLSIRKFYRTNFGSWVEGLIAYEIYEATVNN